MICPDPTAHDTLSDAIAKLAAAIAERDAAQRTLDERDAAQRTLAEVESLLAAGFVIRQPARQDDAQPTGERFAASGAGSHGDAAAGDATEPDRGGVSARDFLRSLAEERLATLSAPPRAVDVNALVEAVSREIFRDEQKATDAEDPIKAAERAIRSYFQSLAEEK